MVTLCVGFITLFAAAVHFCISRQDSAIKSLREEFTDENTSINNRIDDIRDKMVARVDVDRLHIAIRELKADITTRLEQNYAIIQTMQRDYIFLQKDTIDG